MPEELAKVQSRRQGRRILDELLRTRDWNADKSDPENCITSSDRSSKICLDCGKMRQIKILKEVV